MEKLSIFSTVLLIVQTCCHLRYKHYGWCSPYDAFCLFSEGTETRVSNLSEAQLKCSEIKIDSWPVELGDERVKEVFIEFIHNHSISNVILNAFNRNGIWYWKTSNRNVTANDPFEKESGIVLVYNNSEYYSNYSVVCMTNCKANWSFENQTGYNPDQGLEASHDMSIKSLEECKEICESSVKCSSVDWTYESTFHGCWMQKYPYDINKRDTKNGTSHHALDRSAKSFDRCIGGDLSESHHDLQEITTEKSLEISRPLPNQSNLSESHHDLQEITTEKSLEISRPSPNQSTDLNLVPILVPIFIVVLTSAVIVFIVIFIKKRKINANHPQQNGGQNPDDNINHHENEEVNKVNPKRYLGPRGDIYTDVNISELKRALESKNIPLIKK